MKFKPAHLIFGIAAVIFSVAASAQTIKVVPPTPNAAKMTEYYGQRPNLYTGTANVNIPVYTIEFDGWQLPIALNYNATGIRTNEEASEVGLGWSLSATGIVSRTVRGGDDFYAGGQGNGWGRGFVYNDRPMPVPFDIGYDQFTTRFAPPNSYYRYLATSRPDTQPDIFNYSFFGHSGQFTLTQKMADTNPVYDQKKVVPLKLTEDASLIEFNEAQLTFTITTPDGFIGEFTAKERSTSMAGKREANNRTAACGEDQIDFLNLLNESGRFRVISSWYLTKITSPRGEEILFHYDLDANGNSMYISNERNFAEDNEVTQTPQCLQTVHEHVYLKDITYNNHLKVEFVMEDREDIRRNTLFDPASIAVNLFPYSQNLKRYREIRVTGLDPASTLDKTITLSQTYFNQHYHKKYANDEDELQWLRSRLDRITIDDQEYSFKYYKGTKGLPNKHTTGIDHFGFFNGQEQNRSLLWPYVVGGRPAECKLSATTDLFYRPDYGRLVDFTYGKAGLLEKTTYPTRGYTVFDYEAHSYHTENTSAMLEDEPGEHAAGGARIKTIREYNYTGEMVRSRSYRYTPSGDVDPFNPQPSTGKLMMPLLNLGKQALFVFDTPGLNDPDQCEWLFESNSSIPGNNAAEGKVIGYSAVHEIVEGGSSSFKNSYYFENRPSNVNRTLLGAEGFENINGQARETRNLGSDNKILQRTVTTGYDALLGTVKAVAYFATPSNTEYLGYWQDYDIKRFFVRPTQIVTTTSETGSGLTIDPVSGNITSSTPAVTTQKSFTYSNQFLLRSEETTNSSGETIRVEYKRAGDYQSPGATIAHMKAVNLLEPVIEQTLTRNGQVVDGTAKLFQLQSYGSGKTRVNLSKVFAYNRSLGAYTESLDGQTFSSANEMREDYKLYDVANGNLLEYATSDGVIHSFKWGYNGTLPIVHGAGISYNLLNTAYNATSALPNSEEALRAYPGVSPGQITTYTHNPKVGIGSITDAARFKKSFVYDANDRLSKVLDQDGNTIEQYDFHLRERQVTRVMSVPGSLDFGTLTPDMFAPQFLEYARCSNVITARTLTIANTGEDNLTVHNITVPSGFASSWQGGIIPPDESVDVIISFTATTPGTHSGLISISSDQTTGPGTVTVQVSANYQNRICNLTFSQVTGAPPVFNIGTTTGSFATNQLSITNNGNAPFRFVAFPLNWDGIGNNYASFTSPDFSITGAFANCVEVGQTVQITTNFTPTGFTNGERSVKLSIITDIDPNVCPALKDAITLKATVNRPISVVSVDTTPIAFGNFPDPYKSKQLTISNTGTLGFTVSGFSSSTPNTAQHFSLIPQTAGVTMPFVLNPGQSEVVELRFAPTTFGPVTTDITILNDAMMGDEAIAVTGNRYPEKKIELLRNGIPVTQLDFDQPNTSMSVTVRNSTSSNSAMNVTGVSVPGTANWSAWIDNLPVMLQPGQSTSMTVRKNNNVRELIDIAVSSDKTTGNEILHLTYPDRPISVSATAFPVFTSAFADAQLTITNGGASTLTVGSITASDPGRFTFSESTNFTVAGNASKVLTLRYTPDDFLLKRCTLTINSDATNGTPKTIIVEAQRTEIRTVSINPTMKYVDGHATEYFTVRNTGNNTINITGVNYAFSSGGSFSATSTEWDAAFTPVAAPTLAPDATATLRVFSKKETAATQFIRVTYNKSSVYSPLDEAEVRASSRVITLSSPGFSSFTSSTADATLSIQNAGNTTLLVTGITSSNARFTFTTATTLSIPAGSTQTVNVRYSPDDFALQSTTLTVSSNSTNGVTPGTSTFGLSAQRTEVRTISINPTMKYVDGHATEYFTVRNTGNTTVTISGVNYAFSSGGSYASSSTEWDAAFTPAANPVLAADATATLRVFSKKETASTQFVRVVYNKTSGLTSADEAEVRAISRIINLSASSYGTFTSPTADATLTIQNTGNTDLQVSGVTSSNPRYTFTTATAFTVPSGSSRTVNVRYTPTDFSLQSTTITVSSNSTNGATPGVATIGMSAQRTEIRTISLQSSLVYAVGHGSVDVTVTNNGNAAINISGVQYAFTSGGSYTSTSTEWQASFTPVSAPTLLAGESTTLRIFSAVPTSQTAQTQFIRVSYNKTSGYTSADEVEVRALTRQIAISSVGFPAVTCGYVETDVLIGNNGNSNLTVSNVVSSNTPMFQIVSGTSFTVAPGSSQAVRVRYNPSGLGVQSTTLTVYSDATNATGTSTFGLSSQNSPATRVIALSTSLIDFSFQGETKTVTVYNYGNSPLTISSISPSFQYWSIQALNNVTLNACTGSVTFNITRTGGSGFGEKDIYLTINSNKTSGSDILHVTY